MGRVPWRVWEVLDGAVQTVAVFWSDTAAREFIELCGEDGPGGWSVGAARPVHFSAWDGVREGGWAKKVRRLDDQPDAENTR